MIYDSFLNLDDIGVNGSFNPLMNNPVDYLKADSGVYSDGAVQFVASDKSSLQIADASQTGLDPLTNDFSINLWLYADAVGANATVLQKGATSGSAAGYWMRRLAANTIRFYFGDGSATEKVLTSTSALAVSTWTNVCFTCSRAGLMSVYWNGNTTPEATVDISAQAGSVNSALAFILGAISDGSDAWFPGRMDSVGVWNKALSTAEITSLYNAGAGKMYSDLTAGEKTSLAAWWEMNEEAGIRYGATGVNHLQQSAFEMVTNGTFTGNDTGWTPGAGWVYGANTEVATAATADLTQTTVVPTVGKKYKVTATYVITTGTVCFTFGGVTGTTRTTSGTYTSYITATSTATLAIHPVSTFTGTVDTVSVQAVEITSNAGIASGLSLDGNLCASFNGSTQYLTKASNASLETGDIDFTAFGWINPSSVPVGSSQSPFGKYGASADKREWAIFYATDGKLNLTVSPDGTSTDTGSIISAILPVNNWYFIVAKHNSVNNLLKMKINNVSITDVAYTGGLSTFDCPFQIGARGDNTSLFAGRVDNVGFIKRLTTDAEDTSLFNLGKGTKYAQLPATVSTDALLKGFWELNEYSASAGAVTRKDSTTNANDLTDTGTTPSGQGVGYFEGTISKASDSSGNGNDFIQLIQSAELLYRTGILNGLPVFTGDGLTKRLLNAGDKIGAGDVTVVAVITPRGWGGGNGGRIVDNGQFGFALNSTTGRLTCFSNGSKFIYSADSSIALGTSYVTMVTRTSAGVTNFYINGTLSGSADQDSGTPAAGSPTYLLNNDASTRGFDGDVANPMLFPSILNAYQIAMLNAYMRKKYAI